MTQTVPNHYEMVVRILRFINRSLADCSCHVEPCLMRVADPFAGIGEQVHRVVLANDDRDAAEQAAGFLIGDAWASDDADSDDPPAISDLD